ncbi:antibiotic biosynthesis monooxygenase [Bradyrhizobium sp. UFLA01-814]|uniref:putative quinol monooxygenase n=1 Tax=Bradyrhizobium sp. UFLA01-814 TaxID=3023480 RepID=UPI00398AD667
MPKLALIATVEVAPEKRDRARSLRDEPGTLNFEILVPREDAAKLLIYEVYQDDAAFEAHRNARSIAQFREESAGLGIKISATRCTPAA